MTHDCQELLKQLKYPQNIFINMYIILRNKFDVLMSNLVIANVNGGH